MRLVKSRMRDTPLSWEIQMKILDNEMNGKRIPFIERVNSFEYGDEFRAYLKRWGDWYGIHILRDRLKYHPYRKNHGVTFKGKFYGHH